ncbi:MAG TPA: nucleotide exchange factor GrpE [Actinomycetes bacterium]|nr:nucleotide exchange factor GrpE [Actinomycetes bacterium]
MTDRPRDEHGPSDEHGQPEEQQGPIVRDKRRIDPTTGALREPVTPASAAPGVPDSPADGLGDDVADELSRQIAERTADLQRVQAEYANYRRRVDRDREVIRETAVANVLANLLPVLDDIGRARDHGELEGGFKSVGEALEAIVDKLGLVRFGTPGEPFDPTVHEALTHTQSPDVTETTCVEVYQPGYRIGDRVVRPARVAVADPE